MEIEEQKSGDALVIVLTGRLDAQSANGAQEKVLAIIARGEKSLIFDLEKLSYISSAGLRVFIVAGRQVKTVGGKLVFCSLKATTKELFEISGFASLYPICATREEAVGKLSGA